MPLQNNNPLAFETTFSNRRMLVTGHTGFTGGWLCSWLLKLGADLSGLALPAQTDPALFSMLGLEDKMTSHIGDINDLATVQKVFDSVQPEIVFHLAAQPIVSLGYDDPVLTYMTNVMGTLHVLEAARNCENTKAVVCITTDKVYENKEWHWAYRENDSLGGKDPYSASKACAELVAGSYIQTMNKRGNGMRLVTARGGNIIGGGDWADNRIVPDFVRALKNGDPLTLRHPEAVRPWQHVLALVHGYMLLADRILTSDSEDVWNFGPTSSETQSVRTLVEKMATHWKSPKINFGEGRFPEAGLLQIDSTRARKQLGWQPGWLFEDTVKQTADWYQAWMDDPASIADVTNQQIDLYRTALSPSSQQGAST